MTVEKLIRILRENDIPEDAILMSDSGWEWCESDMDGVYYCAETNTIIFTQDYASRKYNEDPNLVKLGLKEEWIFTRIYFDRDENAKYRVECPSCHEKWVTNSEIIFGRKNELCPNCGVRKANYYL